jgi:hypothetical protein
MEASQNQREPLEPTSGSRIFCISHNEFREQLEHIPFVFLHTLAHHPLFELSRLSKLAATVSQLAYYEERSQGVVESGWNPSGPQSRFSLEESVLRIGELRAWIILKHAEGDPDYRALLNDCMREIEELSGWNLARETQAWEMQIMITSPLHVTPFHIDNECNFLLQIAGTKTINIFDREDREVLREEELERFWANDQNAAVYRPDLQSRACVCTLAPNKGVHVPVNSPHWVQNDNNISISVSINTELVRDIARRVYRVNHYLRKLGLTPMPPGKSAFRDKLKYATLLGVKRIAKLAPKSSSPPSRNALTSSPGSSA